MSLLLLACVTAPLAAQRWDDSATMALVERAVHRREAARFGGLEDYQARAHGFVFFLAQLGEAGLAEPAHLIRSDQLELEVYWKAPGLSKQEIVGRRDRVDLPTDIAYHRDHLGIIQNGFGDRIRLGQGDEVRNVPHPLAPSGPALYDYRVVDSLAIDIPGREVRVHEIAFRPKDPAAARIAGVMYLDAADGALVRLRFNFTRRAYRDPTVEDITILLDNALWDGRYWLPHRQEIEIRRRADLLDIPARGIIRGRWRIDDYRFNRGLSDSLFWGPEIAYAPPGRDTAFRWSRSLDRAIGAARDAGAIHELEQVRRRVRDLVAEQMLSGLHAARPGIGSVSDLLHFNRVEGLAPGAGWVLRPARGRLTLRGWGSWGASDHRPKGRFDADWRRGRLTLGVRAAHVVQDVGDEPVIAPLVNSLLAQERGDDYGDYVLASGVGARATVKVGVYGAITASAGWERTTSVIARAAPAAGTLRPNAPLGGGGWAVGAVGWERRPVGNGLTTRLAATVGLRDTTRWLRLRLGARWTHAAPGERGQVALSGWVGWGSGALPRDRGFLLGGRGTLVGEPFRAYGGRRAGLARLEWAFPVPFPAIRLGAYASTGRHATLAPFVAVGWVDEPIAGTPWVGSGGVRPIVGTSIQWFNRLLRTEVGWSPRAHRVGITLDVQPELWPIL